MKGNLEITLSRIRLHPLIIKFGGLFEKCFQPKVPTVFSGKWIA